MKKAIIQVKPKETNSDNIFYQGNVLQLKEDARELVIVTNTSTLAQTNYFAGVRIATCSNRLGNHLSDLWKSLWQQFEGEIKITI